METSEVVKPSERVAIAAHVHWLHKGAEQSARSIGGKGANLSRLARAGHQVPQGFAISADAFAGYLVHNGAGLGADQAMLVERIKSGAFPDELQSQILHAYSEMGEGQVAVRSSATDEDSAGASFAGQHATLLDVSDKTALIDAVRACWASLFSDEAMSYRRAQGKSAEAPRMGVVVQRMVRSETSGVAFTIDPVRGEDSVIVVDAVRGLGEALVSGRATPDHHRVQKDGLSIAHREVRGDSPVLSDQNVVDLAKRAMAIEALFGAPQDIEWAIAGGEIWILQSRPVTGARTSIDAAEWSSELDTPTSSKTQWTTANIQEVMPGLLTPLTWSFLGEDFDRYTRVALKRLGLNVTSKDPMVGSFYGRAVMNLSLAQEIGGQTATADEHYFGAEQNKARAKVQPAMLLKMIVVVPKSILCFARLERSVKSLDDLDERASREDAQTSLGDRALDSLVAAIEERTGEVHQVGAAHVLVSIYNGAMFTILGKLAEKMLGDKNGELQSRLVKGLAELDSARPAYEMWALASDVRSSAELKSIFKEKDGRAIERALDSAKSAEAQAFRGKLRAFLKTQGHHSIAEMELSSRTWEEDQAAVLVMIRNYVDAKDEHAPNAIEERGRKDREEATKSAFARLNVFARPLFRYFLGKSQTWIPLREHTKSLLIRAMHRRRRVVKEIGRRLAAQGTIAEPTDIFYLTKGEIGALSRGALSADDARAAIAKRRSEERKNRQVSLPENFVGRPKPQRSSIPAASDQKQLTGIPVSRGVVTGRARVIMDPQDNAVIEPGEIMIAPITDAGWTPLFTVAGGLVVDVGGALSHGSTVAREYGLPAVVNVKVGTQVIKTGDVVTVDGTRGVVVLGGAS
jgi:pyruvate,water dikinase